MAADKGVIAGQGWVFYAEPDTEQPTSLENFTPATPAVDKFTWLGSTSKENLTSFAKEGGEITVLDTWDTPAMRSIKADEKWSVTINAVAIAQETFKLAFPSGTWDGAKNSYNVDAKAATSTKSLLVVIKDDVNGYVGVYFPRGTMSLGDVPVLNAEGFMEVPLVLNALTSETSGVMMSWILPKKLQTESGGVEEPEAEGGDA